jgi:biotin carboxyl carrier protein
MVRASVVLVEVDVKDCDVELEDEVCSLERMKMMIPPWLFEINTRN